jgi:hypothetical protein
MSNHQKEELEKKLIALFQGQPDLFEEIDREEYAGQTDEDDEYDYEALYCAGEAGLIEIDQKTYRFQYDELSDYIGEEIYDW